MKKFTIVLCALMLAMPLLCQEQDPIGADDSSGDFSEFEDFDDDFGPAEAGDQDTNDRKQASKSANDEDFANGYDNDDNGDGIVEDDDNEFEHFKDEEEFEGFNKNDPVEPSDEKPRGEPKITIAKVPMHFRTHWDSYWLEMLMIVGLLAYFVNYMLGRTKNSKIANLWLSTHRSLLEDNFLLIGDDGNAENDGNVGFVKESESLYTLWCSGRTCCEGMLVELKLIKRQDLVSIVSDIMKPAQDQIHMKIEISKDIMDTFILCVASKRTAAKYFKEMYDLNKYCTLVSNPETKYNVPNGFSVLSEIPEATAAVLDSRVLAALSKFGHMIDYIYISDQHNGVLTQDDSAANLKMPDVKKQLLVGFNLPKLNDMEAAKPVLVLVFYLLEKLKRYRMSKEGKNKADKNRNRVEEEFLKSTHSARAEAAALRREEKRKQEKERVLADDDPEKHRRWEKKEQKRQQKRKAPKMKQLSVKAL